MSHYVEADNQNHGKEFSLPQATYDHQSKTLN